VYVEARLGAADLSVVRQPLGEEGQDGLEPRSVPALRHEDVALEVAGIDEACQGPLVNDGSSQVGVPQEGGQRFQ